MPRRTEVTTFSEVVAKAVALWNSTRGYAPKRVFLGYQVKFEPENAFACSEYDKFILIFRGGRDKVINGINKLLFQFAFKTIPLSAALRCSSAY